MGLRRSCSGAKLRPPHGPKEFLPCFRPNKVQKCRFHAVFMRLLSSCSESMNYFRAGWHGTRLCNCLLGQLCSLLPQAFQELLSFFELRKEFLFFSKSSGMHEAAAAAELDGMPQVQHLMIDEIFDGIERDARGIENAADDDGIVRGIIVAQAAESLVAAPGHLRPSHQAMEETEIQLVKNLVEIIVLAFGTLNALASAQSGG